MLVSSQISGDSGNLSVMLRAHAGSSVQRRMGTEWPAGRSRARATCPRPHRPSRYTAARRDVAARARALGDEPRVEPLVRLLGRPLGRSLGWPLRCTDCVWLGAPRQGAKWGRVQASSAHFRAEFRRTFSGCPFSCARWVAFCGLLQAATGGVVKGTPRGKLACSDTPLDRPAPSRF